MKKIKILFALLFMSSLFAGDPVDGEGFGGAAFEAPINTNEIVLVIAAVLLTIGVVAYRKLSLKKA